MIHAVDDVLLKVNFEALMRERGKIVPRSRRDGHNVFTTVGKNWLAKLIGWQSLASVPDDPFTHRRVRWMGVGTGTQLEQASVTAMAAAATVDDTNFITALNFPATFPSSTSVRFSRVFTELEITTVSNPIVAVTEAGLFADVNPATMGGTEDAAAAGVNTTLDPKLGTNSPIAYKVFDVLTKTQDFTLEIRWDFKF